MNESSFASTLTALRVASGCTQEQIAQELGISNRTLSKWETGASEPDLAMLVKLASYYRVSVDVLLGQSTQEPTGVRETVGKLFQGLSYRETVQASFEILNALFEAECPNLTGEVDEPVVPVYHGSMHRSHIFTRAMHQFIAHGEDVNIAVMLYGNRANFAWLQEEEKRQKISTLFEFLSDPDVLRVCGFLHRSDCSKCFTADYSTTVSSLWIFFFTIATSFYNLRVNSCMIQEEMV